MTLPDNIDLTPDRDFGSQIEFRPGIFDQLAFHSTRDLSVSLQVAAGVDESLQIVLKRFYPWNIHKVESDSFLSESCNSEDEASRMIGFEFWDDTDRPFVLGSYSERKTAKYLLEMESGDHCDCCGKKLDLFDEQYTGSKYHQIFVCKHCRNKHIRDMQFQDIFG